MDCFYGKDIDLLRLKKPVISDLNKQVHFWKKKAGELYPLTGEVISCPICGSEDYEDCFQIYGFWWRQCQDCSHVFNSRTLPDDQMAIFYRNTKGEIKYSSTYSDPSVLQYRLDHVARPKVDFVEKYVLPKGKRKKRWLDVGCGNGDILKVAQDKGFRVIGIEPNEDLVSYARDVYGVEVLPLYLEEFAQGKSECFDIVSMLGLLDLVRKPMDFLKQAHSLLYDKGIVAISLPNYESLSTAVQSTYNNQIVVRHLYPTVLNMFTLKSAEYALKQANFEIEAIWFFGMDVYEMINNLVLAARDFEGSPLHRFLLESTNELQRVFDSSKKCDKFHIVAKKNLDNPKIFKN